MKLAKKHFAYLTVLAIGGGWLTMDYCTGSAPGESAASAAVTVHEQTAQSSATTALAADMGDEPAIAHRLDTLAQSRHLAGRPALDGFALPAAFAPAVTAPVSTTVPHFTAANTFMGNHSLTSVMVGARASSVLVDGKTFLKLGDKIDDFTLTAVAKNGATFTSPAGVKAVLGFNFSSSSVASVSQSQ